jgi:menaquinone-dependent protoporphyrinogen oxidase
MEHNTMTLLEKCFIKTSVRFFRIVTVMATAVSLFVVPVSGATVDSCGEGNTGKKILIAYDTKHGSTATMVEKIGEVLCQQGYRVDMGLAVTIDDISSYEAVIVGSPIYWGLFLPGTVSFLDTHKNTLGAVPVAVFAVSNYIDTETGLVNEAARGAFVDGVLQQYPEFTPVEPVGLFPGNFSFKRAHPVEFVSMYLNDYPEGDNINLTVVGEWATTIAGVLQ